MSEIVGKIYKSQGLINKVCFSFCNVQADREDLFQKMTVIPSWHMKIKEENPALKDY